MVIFRRNGTLVTESITLNDELTALDKDDPVHWEYRNLDAGDLVGVWEELKHFSGWNAFRACQHTSRFIRDTIALVSRGPESSIDRAPSGTASI